MVCAWLKRALRLAAGDLVLVAAVAALVCAGSALAAGLPLLLAEHNANIGEHANYPNISAAVASPGQSGAVTDRHIGADDRGSLIGPVSNALRPPAGPTATTQPCVPRFTPGGEELSSCPPESKRSPTYVDDRDYLLVTAKLIRRSSEWAMSSYLNQSNSPSPGSDRSVSPPPPEVTPVRPAGAADADP